MIKTVAIDPVAYAIFSHRLWAIGEEGRLTLQRVTASPIVAQGGEWVPPPKRGGGVKRRVH